MTGVNWDDLFKTLGSTTIIVAALGFIAKTLIDHFFQRDVEAHKARLKRETDTALADAKLLADAALLRDKARFDEVLEAQKAEFARQTATFNTQLAARGARADRIRQEVVRWANPILGAVIDLESRLRNMLDDEAYLALSPETDRELSSEWSITYDYFLPSTVYLFCQYFCWIRLLEEKLSFELFEKHAEKDAFFGKVQDVGRKLSTWPLPELEGVSENGDRQVFRLQQRALGETLDASSDSAPRCMRYSEFLVKWPDDGFKSMLSPITDFIDRVQPQNVHRWRRLELMAESLQELRTECERILSTDSA